MTTILPVILAGGNGSRLWPMSRSRFPKQFLSFFNGKTMLQETISRLDNLEHLPPCFICNEEHRFLVAEQVRQIHTTHSGIILEPVGRNTAPAVALAALNAQQINPHDDLLLLILAADHVIKDIDAFAQTIQWACHYAEQNHLVTFGITPTSPETGYGYIRRGEPIKNTSLPTFFVNGFVEKPDQATAKHYLRSQYYYWNSGMFLFKASRYLEELGKFRPHILATCQEAFSHAKSDLEFTRISDNIFTDCPSESVDYAVMENTDDAVVIQMDVGWSDVGAWSSLWEISNKDTSGNAIQGDVIDLNTHNCYIHGQDRLIATVGIDDLEVIDTKDALLIAHRKNVQDIKTLVSQLTQQHRPEVRDHREVYRPWGKHDHIAEGPRYHVKKVLVKPGGKTAMQIHYHRSEHWIIVSGTAKVYKGNQTHIISENESIYIPVGVQHCIENPGKVPLELIEVRTGCYLKDDDIVRIGSSDAGY